MAMNVMEMMMITMVESWFTNLEKMPLNRSQQLPCRTNDLLTRSSKTNYERTTGELTI